MLTISKVSSGAAAANYYEDFSDYYLRDDPSSWQGKGAGALGLSGQVDFEIFRNLINGNLPNGAEIHNVGKSRCGALDFTFSAPKSISMQSLVGGDKRLIAAHELAASRALDYAQTLAAYRITSDGVTVKEQSANLTVATFLHDLSRANDPNLHTHAVILNITQRPDGGWRSLEQTDLYRQKMLMGALYRSELAQEVKKLGYEVRVTHVDGRFELAHISEAQVKAFSTRSQQIEAMLSDRGLTRETASSKEKEVANLATRDKKGVVDRKVLMDDWIQKSQEFGVDYSPSISAQMSCKADSFGVKDVIDFAIEHTTERQSIVEKSALMRAALERGIGVTNLTSIQREIERRVEVGELIASGDRYTTEAALKRELDIISIAQRGCNRLTPVAPNEVTSQCLSNTSLNLGQSAAVRLILNTEDRVVAIQGSAGTGKTFMLEVAKNLAEAEGYEVRGLAPSAAAAKELEKVGIDSQTIASFGASKSSNLNEKTILLVDEAGMVSAKDMQFIFRAAELSNSRVVLIGDTQQLQAVEAGKPFAQLQESGISRVEVGEILRQSDQSLRLAVEMASQGEIGSAIGILEKHIHEINDDRSRYEQIAKDYAALAEGERSQTLVVAGTKYACTSINQNIRSELDLAGNGIEVATLERKDLTQAQAKMSTSYQPGDVIEAKKDFSSLGLSRGDLAVVVHGDAGLVQLERSDGVQVDWRPAVQTNMIAYKAIDREFSSGDVVRFTGNDYAMGVTNGDRAVVASIDQEKQLMTMQKMDGDVIALDLSQPQKIDYAYCTTIHSAQGQSSERVLIEADTASATSNENAFYVAISRARSKVEVYTDDKYQLPESMGRENVKESALELVQESRSHSFDL